jgi:hypothetical protein
LAEGEDLLATRRADLEPLLAEYIEASAAAARANEKRRRRRTRAGMVAMAIITLLAVSGGALAWWQRAEAQRNAETAQSNGSRALASLAENEVERRSPATAVRLALAALPMRLDSPDRAYAREAEGALLYGVQHLRERRRFLHEHSVHSVAFSPDGRTLATGSLDTNARLWEVATGKEIATMRGHEQSVQSVAFSPDGRTLATGSWDSTARLWEVATGKEIAAFRGHEHFVESVTFSPDGRTLATGGHDNTVRLWPQGERLIDLACARVHDLPFSADDKQRFGIENEWCTPEVSGALRAKLGLDLPLEGPQPADRVGASAN